MYSKNFFFLFLLSALFVIACTPKVPEVTVETETPKEESHPATEPKEDKNLSPCPRFTDAPNPEQILDEYVLYRDFMKAGDWTGAFKKWQKVYEIAPAADGQRNTVFADGIRFYDS